MDEFQEEQEQEDQGPFPPNMVTHDPTIAEYPIHELIGSDGAIIVVHRAFDNMSVHNLSVAVKLIWADQESQDYNDLVQRVERNGLLPDHRNVLEIQDHFTDRGIYCVIFPYMGHGSLRSIMQSQFPNGIPLKYLVVALREALQGLCFLHDNGQVHREISAGHIFFSRLPEIKLSFSGTVYDHDADQDDPHFLSLKSISRWASSPEVYNSHNDELYDSKADIWMMAVTALELAYGEVKIRSRGHFLSIVDRMKDKQRRLPLKDVEQSPSPWKLSSALGRLNLAKAVLEKRFNKFVYKCLANDPANRPTARQLLDSKLFAKTKKNVTAFHRRLK